MMIGEQATTLTAFFAKEIFLLMSSREILPTFTPAFINRILPAKTVSEA